MAGSPTLRSPSFTKPTTEGVVRLPSELAITTGSLPSKTATQLFVVPKSIPIIFPIVVYCLFIVNVFADIAVRPISNKARANAPQSVTLSAIVSPRPSSPSPRPCRLVPPFMPVNVPARAAWFRLSVLLPVLRRPSCCGYGGRRDVCAAAVVRPCDGRRTPAFCT